MEINRKNYEAYFLDYWENSLSPEQVAELMIFLEENPDLKPEFDSFESITLQPEMEIMFSKKETLKKSTIVSTVNIDSNNYNELLVAKLEGDISEDEKEELTAFMELNPTVKLESNLFRSTILKADLNITYPNKESLKKKGVFLLYRTQFVYGLSIAASIIILMGLYFGFLNQSSEKSRLSELKKIEIIQPKIIANEVPIPEIQRKNSFAVAVSSIPTEYETDITEREDFAVSGMDVQLVQVIKISDNDQIEQYIGARHSTANNFELVSNTDPLKEEGPKQKKSFLKRFIAGLTNKLIDVDRPEKKSFLEYTIDGFNFMADKEVAVDKELDENGNVAYRVNGESVSLGRANRNGTNE